MSKKEEKVLEKKSIDTTQVEPPQATVEVVERKLCQCTGRWSSNAWLHGPHEPGCPREDATAVPNSVRAITKEILKYRKQKQAENWTLYPVLASVMEAENYLAHLAPLVVLCRGCLTASRRAATMAEACTKEAKDIWFQAQLYNRVTADVHKAYQNWLKMHERLSLASASLDSYHMHLWPKTKWGAGMTYGQTIPHHIADLLGGPYDLCVADEKAVQAEVKKLMHRDWFLPCEERAAARGKNNANDGGLEAPPSVWYGDGETLSHLFNVQGQPCYR